MSRDAKAGGDANGDAERSEPVWPCSASKPPGNVPRDHQSARNEASKHRSVFVTPLVRVPLLVVERPPCEFPVCVFSAGHRTPMR
jgi:hypothetical protein